MLKTTSGLFRSKNGGIRIGVTGHRTLQYYHALTESVRNVLQQIQNELRDAKLGNPQLVGISPLAEGADRLVANEILKRAGILEAPLPMPIADYLPDFVEAVSRTEFQELLAQAKVVTIMPPVQDRRDAYEAVGKYVVDNCHVLIALWDGNSSTGRGGTADIVAYAKTKKRPLFWINANKPEEIKFINQRSGNDKKNSSDRRCEN